MKAQLITKNIIPTITNAFHNQYKKVKENMALIVAATLRCNHVNTATIARQMSVINKLDFKANLMKIYRFLQSKQFQVGDKTWRRYIHLLFESIENIKRNQKQWTINVDYTTSRDDFLILMASLVVCGESVPLYFSMRRYPRNPGMHSQKKMEKAFFTALRHLLPKKYQYTIVADRGFGHLRIIELLEKNNFFYVLRSKDNLNVVWDNKHTNLCLLPCKTTQIQVYVTKWQRSIKVIKRVKNKDYWILLTNLTNSNSYEIGEKYSGRFSIEKMFKNQKSGGFNLEKVKIEKYDRFKKLLFISCIAYFLVVLSGLLVHHKAHAVKKNFSNEAGRSFILFKTSL